MAEYIARMDKEKTRRLIDADELRAGLVDAFLHNDINTNEDILSAIDTSDTIDPVHAAGGCYCRECAYQSYDPEFGKRWCDFYTSTYQIRTDGNGFCDRGERKEAQGNE